MFLVGCWRRLQHIITFSRFHSKRSSGFSLVMLAERQKRREQEHNVAKTNYSKNPLLYVALHEAYVDVVRSLVGFYSFLVLPSHLLNVV